MFIKNNGFRQAHYKKEAVSCLRLSNLAPELKPSQTFEIILPNLIHKSNRGDMCKLNNALYMKKFKAKI